MERFYSSFQILAKPLAMGLFSMAQTNIKHITTFSEIIMHNTLIFGVLSSFPLPLTGKIRTQDRIGLEDMESLSNFQSFKRQNFQPIKYQTFKLMLLFVHHN